MLAFDCERWKCLPTAGGVLDQPAGLVRKMSNYLNVFRAFEAYSEADKTKMAAWKKNNRLAWDVVKSVNAMRKEAKRE
ncbi:MAG TPA: hypothetical protein PLU23_00665 [Anaerolineaceae bacterium]|nr:hypothetical protein [Anaerolineaceae bacterium]